MSQISDQLTSVEIWNNNLELLGMQWTDWEDFESKYSTTGNPEAAARRLSILGKFENIGWLMEKGMLDSEWVYSQFHSTITPIWIKFEPYVKQTRRAFNSPTIYIDFEYLGRKLVEIEKAKGIEAVIPTNIKDMHIGDRE